MAKEILLECFQWAVFTPFDCPLESTFSYNRASAIRKLKLEDGITWADMKSLRLKRPEYHLNQSKFERRNMGNHIVGNMFASGAKALEPYIDSFTQKDAEEALDRIWSFVKNSYYFSGDAEFDDFANRDEPLGKLLIKVFAFEKYDEWKNLDWETASDELEEEADEIYWIFKKKYGLY